MTLGKRALDVVASAVGLVVLSPLLLVIAVLVRLSDGGPALFRQERVGWRGRPFAMLKFRSMRIDANRQGLLITADRDPRITRIGGLLRAIKLDELPQLVNVLRGEMSLVGPRPEVARYVALYTPEQRRVLELVPGITDPASTAYLQEGALLARASDPERVYIEEIMPAKLALNLQYADRATLRDDITTILSTFTAIARRGGSVA